MFTIMIVDDNEQLQNEIGNLLIANRYSILKPTDFNKISQTSGVYVKDIVENRRCDEIIERCHIY